MQFSATKKKWFITCQQFVTLEKRKIARNCTSVSTFSYSWSKKWPQKSEILPALKNAAAAIAYFLLLFLTSMSHIFLRHWLLKPMGKCKFNDIFKIQMMMMQWENHQKYDRKIWVCPRHGNDRKVAFFGSLFVANMEAKKIPWQH